MKAVEIIRKIEPIMKRHGVSFAGAFGSRARGEERADSDLDLLVRFERPKSFFELVGLEHDLAETLHMDVDVVTEGALSPLIEPQVMKGLTPLYGQR